MTPASLSAPRAGRWLLGAIAVLAAARLLSLPWYPLMDTTEARYADIARRMLERADWVTPWIGDGVPFWGKPPLSFWATEIGFMLFGVGEWGARVPHYLLGIAVAALTWRQARAWSARAAWHAVALLAGSLLFLVASGAVMTDMALALGTTAVMVGFWQAMNGDAGDRRTQRRGGWTMALGAVVGLLAKGPIALVLCGLPIGAWVLFGGRLRGAWQRVAWLRGVLLVLALSLPWYLWAESRTPGFLQYFIVGEHWQRFVTPGWKGDLYGSAHVFPRGTIWLFAVGATLPWSLLLPFAAWAGHEEAVDAPPRAPGETAYLFAWALAPCLFFSAAGNILWTYVLPGLPALALLGGRWTASRRRGRLVEGLLAAGLLLGAAAMAATVVAGRASGRFDAQSTQILVQAWQRQASADEALYFLGRPPSSASFYSAGQARALADLADLPPGRSAWVVLSRPALAALAPAQRERLSPVAEQDARVLMRWR